jgi:hypothetical protein
MSGQLSLFPTRDLPAVTRKTVDAEMGALDEMFKANRRIRRSREFVKILQFIARFPKYSAFNGFLLYTQNPNATRLATAGTWLKQFGRTPLYSARPLIILAPMSPVRFVYDLAETEGEPFLGNAVESYDIGESLLRETYRKTVNNSQLHGIAVHGDPSGSDTDIGAIPLTYESRKKYRHLNLDSRMKYLIMFDEQESLANRFAAMVKELGHIFCGHMGIDELAWWQDSSGVDRERAEMEAEATAFLACYRQGVVSAAKRFLFRWEEDDQELPFLSLNSVFHATQYIEQMGKTEWKQPKKKSRYQRE